MSGQATPEVLHVLIGPNHWGTMSAEQAREWSEERLGMFQCGICSDESIQTYHNLWGYHRHTPVEKIREMLVQVGALPREGSTA